MNLVPITIESCLMMARQLSEVDPDDQQSTWTFDTCMQKRCDTFAIEKNGVPIGFAVMKSGGFGEWLLWISLQPSSRNHTNGALALHLALSWIFYRGARYVLSDVFQDNTRSMRIHEAIFGFHDNKRVINGKKVTTFIMNKNRYEENLKRFKRIIK